MWGKVITRVCTDTRHGQAFVFTPARDVCMHMGEECVHTHTCASSPGTQGKSMDLCPRVPGKGVHTHVHRGEMRAHTHACAQGKSCACVHVQGGLHTHRGEVCVHVHTCECTRGRAHTPVHTHRGRHRCMCTHTGEGTHACAHTRAIPPQKAACQGGRQHVRAGVKAAERVKWGVRARPGASAAPAARSPSVPLMPSAADSPAGAAAAGGWGSSARQNH